ncbi:MAG TPA: alpha/beta hydrolase-fold protein [Gemmatimonadaceae bacterium]|nr:alpha/beta hydrolase-fold protein [Gemmatimonadaceae bacterium]
MRYIARAFFLVLLPATLVQAQAAAPKPVTIGVADTMWSATLKENRRLLVYTPPSYNDTTYQARRYPVLYLLDGDAHFHSMTGLAQILGTGVNGTYVLPEMIIVAISNTNRTRDMTPTHTDRDLEGKPQPGFAASGGGANFLGFIKNELIPRIEKSYRTAPYRVLVGHSFGGIVAINALYTMPETFNAYVAIDPSLWWDNRVLLKQAREKFSKPGLAGKALYVAQANTITPGDTTLNMHFNAIVQFNSTLETFNNSGIRYAYKYYPHDSHGSVPMIAEYDAMRFIFEPYDVSLALAIEQPDYLADHFAKASAALGYRIDPPESMVNQVANIALGADSASALKLFEMNASLYPGSANAHSALGDFWLAKKDSAKALGHFEKAVALRPGAQRAKDMVAKLKASGQPAR